MKKFLLVFGILFALVVAGCSQADEEQTENEGNDEQQTEEQTDSGEETAVNEQEVKAGLLNAQLELAELATPFQQAINNYQASVGSEEVTPEQLQTLADEAKVAATEAQTALEGFEVSDLPEETKAQFDSAIASLSAYYSEVETALGAEEADLAAAQTKWDEFQAAIASLYEEVGLIVPDMAAAFS